jgi:hypothetical protein
MQNTITSPRSPTSTHRSTKLGNHHASVDGYIGAKIHREHKCRQSLFTTVDKANIFCANTGLSHFQISTDKDGDILIYSNNGDFGQLFTTNDVQQILRLTVADLVTLMMDSVSW